MGYPTSGYEGEVTSWDGTVNTHLIGTWLRANNATLSINGNPAITTGYAPGLVATSRIAGLADWTVSMSGIAPKATPALGNLGTVTFTGGYVAQVKSWNYTINSPAQDITPFSAGSGLFKRYKPGLLTMTGSFVCLVDSATLLKTPTLAGTAAAALVLQSQTSNTVTADAIASAMNVSAPVDGINEVTYSFEVSDNSIVVAGSTNIIPAGTLALPEWDDDGDGVPDRDLTFQQSSGQVWSGPAFWESIAVQCAVDGVITSTINARGAGVLTPPA